MLNKYRVVKLLDFEEYRVEIWGRSLFNWRPHWRPALELVCSYADADWERVEFNSREKACAWIAKTEREEQEAVHRSRAYWEPVTCGCEEHEETSSDGFI